MNAYLEHLAQGASRPAATTRESDAAPPLRVVYVVENEPFYMAETFRRLIEARPDWLTIAAVGLLDFSPVGTRGGFARRAFALARTYGIGTSVGSMLKLARAGMHPSRRLPAVLAAHGVPLARLQGIGEEALGALIDAARPDVVVTLGLNRIIPNSLLDRGATRWVNVHLGLLSRHRGSAPVFWALHDGDSDAGLSVHLIVERVDAGAVLAERGLPVVRRSLFPLVRDLRFLSVGAIHEALDRLRRNDVPSAGTMVLPRVQGRPSRSDVIRFREGGNRFL